MICSFADEEPEGARDVESDAQAFFGWLTSTPEGLSRADQGPMSGKGRGWLTVQTKLRSCGLFFV